LCFPFKIGPLKIVVEQSIQRGPVPPMDGFDESLIRVKHRGVLGRAHSAAGD
jgi:hypothetical protein